MEQVDQLHELVEKIRNIMPEGWEAELDYNPRLRRQEIVVRSAAPMAVNFHYPSSPGKSVDEPVEPPKQETIEISLGLMRFVPAPAWKLKFARNSEFNRLRIHFQEHALRIKRGAYKGGDPVPPWMFRLRNEADERKLQEYTFLWLRTEPEKLPTHYYRQLSFSLFHNYYVEILDPKQAEQYNRILEKLERIFTAYKK